MTNSFFWVTTLSFQNVLECEHVLGSRTLEVKIATPKVNNIHENLPFLCVTVYCWYVSRYCWNWVWCNFHLMQEEMKSQGTKKATRIFVARIPQSVDESMFRRWAKGWLFLIIYLHIDLCRACLNWDSVLIGILKLLEKFLIFTCQRLEKFYLFDMHCIWYPSTVILLFHT